MSVRILCLLTMLPMIAAFVMVERSSVQINGFDIANSRPHDPALAPDASLWYTRQPANERGRQTGFLPVQSKNAKDLGAGKLLVASRGLADPSFAKTVILLVHYDAEGVVGKFSTDAQMSRFHECLRVSRRRKTVRTLSISVVRQSASEVRFSGD